MSEEQRQSGVPFEELSDTLRRQCIEAILAKPHRSANRLYQELGLTRHRLSVHAWKRAVSAYRSGQRKLGDAAEYPAPPAEETIDEQTERVARMMLDHTERCIRSGDVKPHQVAAVLGAAYERQKVRIQEDANRRAETKIEEWIREQDSKRQAANVVLTKAGVTRDTIEAINEIYGIAPDGGDGHE